VIAITSLITFDTKRK